MANRPHLSNQNSVETILTFNQDEDNFSDWSVVWSTTHVPGMDTATGAGSSRRRATGRRRLRYTALVLAGALTMHVRNAAYALTIGCFAFIVLLIFAVGSIGNPARHFEVYLGQWSISGPGRAFRIIPMIDGTGMAICIHAILRAVTCVAMAAIAGIYVTHTISDDKLPYALCRDFNLKRYEPTVEYVEIGKTLREDYAPLVSRVQTALPPNVSIRHLIDMQQDIASYLGMQGQETNYTNATTATRLTLLRRVTYSCKEKYDTVYPSVYKTSVYNHFYIEVMRYRPKSGFSINWRLLIFMILLYAFIWILIFVEKLKYGRIIWNNMYSWLIVVPWLWSFVSIYLGTNAFLSRTSAWRNPYHFEGTKEVLQGVADSIVIALYIHASGLGSEIILGKGLNHYASGHIDPLLNGEVMWQSSLMWFLTALISGGASLCSMMDSMQVKGINDATESTLWLFPMYAKCTMASKKYSHFLGTLFYGGLCFSYTTVAFVSLKTALHTIFEYRVKLVFIEQLVVFLLLLACTIISIFFTTNDGLATLEALDAVVCGVISPLIVSLEMVGLMYIYRSRDFVSDMNVATEDNTCANRIGIQWQITPFLCFVVFIIKIFAIMSSELPSHSIWMAFLALVMVLLVLPSRAIYNAYRFLHPKRQRK